MATITYSGDDIGTLYLEDLGRRTSNPREKGQDRYISSGQAITVVNTSDYLLSLDSGKLSVWTTTSIDGFGTTSSAPLVIS